MAVKRKDVEGIPVLLVKGKFYGGKETDELQKALESEIAKGHDRIVLDMTECGRVTSPVLSIMLKADEECRAKGGRIVLCGVGGQPLTILEMTNLIFKFDHYPDLPRAVAAVLGATQSAN